MILWLQCGFTEKDAKVMGTVYVGEDDAFMYMRTDLMLRRAGSLLALKASLAFKASLF